MIQWEQVRSVRRSNASCAAFTLVELLVVIGIISTLVAVLLPVFAQVKEAGRRVVCAPICVNWVWQSNCTGKMTMISCLMAATHAICTQRDGLALPMREMLPKCSPSLLSYPLIHPVRHCGIAPLIQDIENAAPQAIFSSIRHQQRLAVMG